jgi:CPA2 family monovalent cation:H+ antiporter-2
MHTTLGLVLILLAAAVLSTALFRSLRLPAMLGYVTVGTLMGPSGFSLANNDTETHTLAEFGIVFLMFSIGLEFSLSRLRAMRGLVFGLGSLQVGLTLLVAAGIGWSLGFSMTEGLVLGGILAMSSTAIVSKTLADRGELDTPHGQMIIGILLFQDLAVVPLMIFIPALASGVGLGWALGAAALKATVVLAVILLLGQRILRPWFHLVAERKSSELFMLNVLFITLGLAYLTAQAGLSLALGAFVAGMLISETEYRFQVESDIRPFRDVLMGLFFVTIGLSLDLTTVSGQLPAVLVVLLLATLVKFALVLPLGRLYTPHTSDALLTGIGLAQAGEFGLVLLTLAGDSQLFEPQLRQAIAAGMVLSMLIAPLLLQHSSHIVLRICGGAWLERARGIHEISRKSFGIEEHVILCGYGRTGQSVARILEAEGIPFIALDHDPKRVKAAAAAGDNVVFGNCSRQEVLMAAGIRRAKALVISFAHTPTALSVLGAVRHLHPGLPVLVRTLDDTDLEKVKQAGATEVVSEVMEGALMLGSQTLLMTGTPLGRVLKHIRQMRERRYSTLRGFFQGASDDEESGHAQERLTTLLIEKHRMAVGRKLSELDLVDAAATVVAVRRHGIRAADPSPDTRLQAGDMLVLRGLPEDLAAITERLSRPV